MSGQDSGKDLDELMELYYYVISSPKNLKSDLRADALEKTKTMETETMRTAVKKGKKRIAGVALSDNLEHLELKCCTKTMNDSAQEPGNMHKKKSRKDLTVNYDSSNYDSSIEDEQANLDLRNTVIVELVKKNKTPQEVQDFLKGLGL